MHSMDRRRFLKLVAQATSAGVVSSIAADGLIRRAEAQSSAALPMGKRFVHLNFAYGGLGWLFTCLQPLSYLDAPDKSPLATWHATTPLDEVRTQNGGRFVLPRPILQSFEASGDRAALETVLDGCVMLFGCGTGAPIHAPYAPSFQLAVGSRTTDVSSVVARHQGFATPYPMLNLGRTNLEGTGTRSFLVVNDNDLSRLFEPVAPENQLSSGQTDQLVSLLEALNPDDHSGPYARTLSSQLLASREASTLLKPSPDLLARLSVDTDLIRNGGVLAPLASQPLALRLARRDIWDNFTNSGLGTRFVGSIEVGALGDVTLSFARGAAGLIQAMETGTGAENAQLDGVQDDPHNKINELHAIANAGELHETMLLKLQWVLSFLVELEKRGLYRDTTILIDGDFSRVLNSGYDDGGCNAFLLFSGGGRLRPGAYGDSGVDAEGHCWFQFPDLLASTPGGNLALLERTTGGRSPISYNLCPALVLHAMGLGIDEAVGGADLRIDGARQLAIFSRV